MKKHRENMQDLDMITTKLNHYLLHEEFEEPKIESKPNDRILSTQSSLERSTSPLKETYNKYEQLPIKEAEPLDMLKETRKLQTEIRNTIKDINVLNVHDLEETQQPQQLQWQQHQQIQQTHDDIDAFIQKAKRIQDSINEAMH